MLGSDVASQVFESNRSKQGPRADQGHGVVLGAKSRRPEMAAAKTHA